jgi:hypothetical protein
MSLGYFDEGTALTGDELVLAKGYDQLVKYLYDIVIAKGGKVELRKVVTEVKYAPRAGVEVRREAQGGVARRGTARRGAGHPGGGSGRRPAPSLADTYAPPPSLPGPGPPDRRGRHHLQG